VSTPNQPDLEGCQKRYLLFGSSATWLATASEFIEDFEYVGHCIVKAREVALPYTLIIDRYDPRVPIYLNSVNAYEPYEML
jgi:hypothetical protein